MTVRNRVAGSLSVVEMDACQFGGFWPPRLFSSSTGTPKNWSVTLPLTAAAQKRRALPTPWLLAVANQLLPSCASGLRECSRKVVS
jgi:hypothetical protein